MAHATTQAVTTAAGTPPAYAAAGSGADDSRPALLNAALRFIVGESAAVAPGSARFPIEGVARKGCAQLAGPWLRLAVPLRKAASGLDPAAIRRMLRRNARYAGWARLVGAGCGPARQAVLDIPVDCLDWDSHAVLEGQLRAAVAELSRTARREAPARQPAAGTAGDEVYGELQAGLGARGWDVDRSAGEGIRVTLDVPGRFIAASLTVSAQWVRLELPLLPREYEGATAPCRDAVIRLLWLIAGRTRMVTPVLTGATPGLALCVPVSMAGEDMLDHMCAALSVAARDFCPPAEHLVADAQLAETYLNTTHA